MNSEALANLHARCFTTPRPWRANEFETLLKTSGVFLIHQECGFALGRIAGPEAELLTIAVHLDVQNQGLGRQLLQDFFRKAAALRAVDVFLEVAVNNLPAIALYKTMGFFEVAKREQYFKQTNGPALTALIMKHSF